MKTDKLLKLIQQKKAMRSGGALPLPKHQSRGQVAPFITSDPKEFARRQQLYKDSLDLYNRQNLYNAQFLANFPNAPVIPNNRVDFGDLVNLVRQQNKTSVEKNATELVNILKEGIQPSKTHSRHYPSDGRYKAHIKRTEGPLLKPGHYVPNSVANRRGLLDSLGVFDDDTKSAKHSYDERIDDPFTNTWIRSGSVTQKWKNPLFGDEHTDQVFGVPYRVIHHAKIKPIGNLLYHQRIPFSTGSSTAAEIFDPSSAMYDDASALNVSLPYYKKPVQEVIYNPRSNAANSPIIVTDRNDPRIGYYTEAGNQIRYRPPAPMSLMPMRGMPSADVEAVPQKVVVPPTPALRPRFMDMRGEWSDVLPTAYPYAQTPEMLEKMGYRGSKKEGGLAKAQVGKPQPIVTLQRDQPITRMVKDPIIGFANDPNVVKYNQTLKDPVWSDPYQFLMNWYSDPVTKERLRKQGAPLNPMVEALNQKRFDDVFDWYLDQQEKNDKLAKSIYSKGDNFNDYVSFKEILNKISEHNYKRHADETNGFHIPSDSSVTITDNRRDKKLNNQTAVHELTHATPLDNFYRNYFENFKPTKADQKELDYFKENLEEIYPRIMDLRFQMNRDGILAPGIKVTPDMIEPYYNNSNDDIRNYYTPKELAKIMNEVAYNASAQESNLARHGGLTKFQSAGSVDFRLGPTVTKANALAKQNLHPVLPKTAVQYINFQDNRVMDPVIKGKKIEPTRRNNIDNVERDKINKIIKQAKLVGVDPATLLTNIIWETRAGETDDNWGHNLYEQTPTIEGLDSDSEKANIAAQGLLRQLNLGKKLYPQGPSYKQLQAYQGYGPLYPDTEKNYYKNENQAFYGIPVSKEKPLLTNKLFPYGKTIEQYRDSVVKPTLDKYSINYQKGGDTKDMVVSDLWKQITGSDWSQAKKLGLTDGSYDQNIALRDRLLKSLKNPAAEKPQLSNSPKAKLTFEPTTQMVAANPMVRDALVIKPSTQQLDYNFFKNQPFGVTDVYSIYPMDRQYEAMKGAYRQDQVYQTPTGIRAYIQNKLNNIKNLTNNDLVNSKIAAITYPVQAGVNIANTIAGDTPIRSDDDVMNLAMDVAAVVPMVKAIKNIAKPFNNINTQTPYRYKWNPEPGIEIIKTGKSSFFKDTPKKITVTDKTARSKVEGYKPLSSLSVKKASDGSYSFDFNLKDAPGSSAKLFKILQSEVRKIQSRNKVWGKNNPMKFYENSTMSLDSYRLLRNRARDPNFNMKPKGTTFLNADASKTRFLDDLADPYISSAEDLIKLTPKKRQNIMNWYADGALMQFSTKKKALEAAKRFNDYFYPGITNIERLAVPRKFDPNTRKWNLEIPNFEFTMKKYGGSTRKIKIIKPK